MQEVAHELHTIRQAHEEAMEAQRYGLQMELEKVREELRLVEPLLKTLKYKINSLKGRKQTPDQRPIQDTPATRNIPTVPSSTKPPKEKETTDLPRKSYAQMAA